MQYLKLLLLPFSILYGIITGLRNFMYSIGILNTFNIPKKSICVGNLEVGGTGKTPHVAYISKFLIQNHSTTILSRGYGRKTKGYVEASIKSTSTEIGDEPKLYKQFFKEKINVVVCEERKTGVQNIQNDHPDNEVIILDDAFQHRAVKAGINILITDYNKPYYKNQMLPFGRLREWKTGRKRADIIIVSKSPKSLDESIKNKVREKLKFNKEKIFFSSIEYGEIKSFSDHNFKAKNILLVTGISNPKPLEEHLKKNHRVESLTFSDHYNFTQEDIKRIHQKFDTFALDNKAIVTTEKDYMRLGELGEETNIKNYPWFYQSITVKIDREKDFKTLIDRYVNAI